MLGNSLSLWKEAAVSQVPSFLKNRYAQDRVSVEDAGAESYKATRRLYVVQAVVLAATIFALIISISLRANSASAEVIGAIISTVGIAVAAITPLQSVGFGISSLAVAITQEREAGEKIRFSVPQDLDESPWLEQVRTLSRIINQRDNVHRPIWVLGPSGVGKTTVLEGLLGLNGLEQNDGRAKHLDDSMRGYSQQTPGLLNATARDNVVFGRNLATELADSALRKVALNDFASDGSSANRDVAGQDGGVSGGERQRIALARALCAPTNSLVVLDEPTSGLDSSSREIVWAYIEEEAQNKIVIVSTHDESAPILEGDAVFRPRIERSAAADYETDPSQH